MVAVPVPVRRMSWVVTPPRQRSAGPPISVWMITTFAAAIGWCHAIDVAPPGCRVV